MAKINQDVCEEKVFDSLFRSMAPVLRNFLVYKFSDLERANDIVQEAFIILWKACKKVPFDKARSFLFKVGQNQFLKLLARDKLARNHQNITFEQTTPEDPEFTLQHQELSKNVADAIQNLPDKQREVFLMNRMDELSYREIAESLGISVKAVEKRMHNALMKLREICYNI